MKLKKLLIALIATSTFAASTTFALTLKAADVHPASHPSVIAVVNMGEKLEQQTNGRIKLQTFFSGVLGDEKSTIEQAQAGGIDFLRVSLGPVGTVVPDVNVFNLPYIFRDEKQLRKVITGPIGDEILQKITDSPAQLVALSWATAGARNFYSTQKPIHNSKDLNGQKIRVMGNPMFVETINLMGGSGISMGHGEIYSALQTGVIDGAENNEPTYVTTNQYTVAQFYSESNHLMIPELYAMSKITWNKLSKEDQVLVKKLAKELQFEQFKLWDKMIVENQETMKAAGVVITKDVDRASFIKLTQPIRDKYGAEFTDLIERINKI